MQRDAIDVPVVLRGLVGDAYVPIRTVWPGFAINTVFYAAIVLLLFTAIRAADAALRCRWRTKRGLCPKCAYPIGESPVCTECGAALPPPSR